MITVGATTMRVFVGLLIASVLGIGVGVLVRYFKLFDQLVLPTVTLLSPVSPIAWLPVAIFLFGIGNGAGDLHGRGRAVLPHGAGDRHPDRRRRPTT